MNENRRGDSFWRVLSLVLLVTLIATVGYMAWQQTHSRPAFYQNSGHTPSKLASYGNSGSPSGAPGEDPYWIADLAQGALPAVVNIQSEVSAEKMKQEHAKAFGQQGGGQGDAEEQELRQQWQQMLPGMPGPQNLPGQGYQNFGLPDNQDVPLGEGSGFVIREDGYIVTNAHVVDGADKFTVTFNDGSTAPAKLVGSDVYKDVAVIKVDKKELAAVQLGDSDKTRIGEPVIAIGSPLGYKASVTSGIVSTNQRSLTDLTNNDDIRKPQHYLQTDAAINRGNSGGPLFNARGEVIGINQAITRWDENKTEGGMVPIEGIGFAIPVNEVKDAIQQIVDHGKIQYPGISVKVGSVEDYIKDYELQYDGKQPELKVKTGVFVHSTVVGGPADKAGIKAGDVILSLDGKELKSANDFVAAITSHHVGDRVTLKVARQGGEQQENVSVVLEELDLSGMHPGE